MDLSSSEDRKKLKDIKKNVTDDIQICSWLELFYAYDLIFRGEQNSEQLKQAETILNYLVCRVIPDGEYLETQLHHIKGQLYWQRYQLFSNKYNFFMRKETKAPLLKDEDEYDIDDEDFKTSYRQALDYLYKAAESNKFAISAQRNEGFRNKMNIDETRGNYALVLIELHKQEKAQNLRPEEERIIGNDYFNDMKITHDGERDFIEKAKEILEEIKEKRFNHYWDLARISYYNKVFPRVDTYQKLQDFIFTDDDQNEVEKLLKEFGQNILKSEKIDEKLFRREIKKEQKEFDGKGFPGSEKFVRYLENMIKEYV